MRKDEEIRNLLRLVQENEQGTSTGTSKWTKVMRSKRSSRGSPKTSQVNSDVDVSNKFGPLQGNGDNDKNKNNDPLDTSDSDSVSDNINKNNANTNTQVIITKPARKLDSPDYIVNKLPVPIFEKAMKAIGVQHAIKIKQNGKIHIKCNYESRPAVNKWLRENKVEGTTSTCNHERIGAAVVKGIHVDYTLEEVKEYLEEQVDFKIDKVRRFIEPKEGQRPYHWWVINTTTTQ